MQDFKKGKVETYSLKSPYFVSIDDSYQFKIKSKNEELIEKFNREFSSLFPVNKDGKDVFEKLTIEMNQSLYDNLIHIIDKYEKDFSGIIRLRSFVCSLNIGDRFVVIPSTIIPEQLEYATFRNYLISLRDNSDFEEIQNEYMEIYGDLFENYHFNSYGRVRLNIGEFEKSKRVCRFCGKKGEEVTFNNKAHAISEALGNKTLLLFDECDNCNEKFSKSIEPDIVNYFSFFRTAFGVHGKNGKKKIKGEDFEIQHKDDVVEFREFESFTSKDGETRILKMPGKAKLGNVYKSLCKYFVSVIDKSLLEYFENTISWINSDENRNNLPKVALKIHNQNVKKQPELLVYHRKNQNINLPFAVGEFRMTNINVLFIVPFNKNYDPKVNLEKNDLFWEAFNFFKVNRDIIYSDFSGDKVANFKFKLNLPKVEQEI